MTLQWAVLAVFFAAMAADHLVFWRGFERRAAADAARARYVLWAQWAATLWGCSALVAALWLARGLPASALGLRWPVGWRLWGPLAATAAFLALQGATAARIARHAGDKSALQARYGDTGRVLPRTAAELPAWVFVSVTAGFCEELLFRGFLVGTLQPLVGVWAAAALSLAVFVAAHLYQGRGMLGVAVFGGLLAALVLATGSLWPAIVLHVAIDGAAGLVAWLVFRAPPGPAPAADAAAAAP